MNLYQEAELGCLWLMDQNWLCVCVFSPSFVCVYEEARKDKVVFEVLADCFLCSYVYFFTGFLLFICVGALPVS